MQRNSPKKQLRFEFCKHHSAIFKRCPFRYTRETKRSAAQNKICAEKYRKLRYNLNDLFWLVVYSLNTFERTFGPLRFKCRKKRRCSKKRIAY